MTEFTPLSISGATWPVRITGKAGAAITSFTPTVSGGTGVKIFEIAGNLPSGLSFDLDTGTISGTPTGVTLGSRHFAIHVMDNYSSASLPVIFNITAAPVSNKVSPTARQPFDQPFSLEQLGLYNFRREQFAPWQAALKRVRDGTGRARVVNRAPSNGYGWGTGIDGSLTKDCRRHSWLYWTGLFLGQTWIPTTVEGRNAAGSGSGIINATGDPTIVSSAGWYPTTTDANIVSGARNGPGGRPFGNGTTTSGFQVNALSSLPWNVCEVFFQVDPAGLGTWKMTNPINSANMSSTGVQALAKAVFDTGLPAADQLARFIRVAGQNYLSAFVFYDNARPSVDFVNLGWPSSVYADWLDATNAWGPYQGFDAIGADLVLQQMGLGEYIAGTDPNVVRDGIVSLVTNDQAKGRSTIIITPTPPNEAAYGGRLWAPYVQAHYDAVNILEAAGISRPLIDLTKEFGGFYQANAFDDVHYLESPAQRIARIVSTVMRMAA